MKLVEELKKNHKRYVYFLYLKIVYDTKEYEDITRNKMIEEILKVYQEDNFFYNICTTKELEFLKLFQHKKVTDKDKVTYDWEIKELNKKAIFSMESYSVYEEQQENCQKALETYQLFPQDNMKDIVIFMIGYIKVMGNILVKALFPFISQVFKIKEEDVYRICGSPLFHFYCEFYCEEFHSVPEDFIFYRDYEYFIDEINKKRKQFGRPGGREVFLQDYVDIFYTGLPIQKEKVKKFYDKICNDRNKDYYLMVLDRARVLYDENFINHIVVETEEIKTLMLEAWKEIPCAVTNGLSPNEYKEDIAEEYLLQLRFPKKIQIQASLTKKEADLYYKLYFGLLEYINQEKQINPHIAKIKDENGINIEEIEPIDNYLWNHKEIISEFIQKNPYHFTKSELKDVEEFKNAISDTFTIIGYEEEYTMLYSKEGKIYMVKGIRENFDKIISSNLLPKLITTTIFMFHGNIIFKSYFTYSNVVLGNDVKKYLLKEMETSMKYYHL